MSEKTDMSFLAEKFDTFYGKAKSLAENGLNSQAKKYYKIAASVMLEMAEASTPEHKKARVARAKRVLEIAEKLGADKQPPSAAPSADEADGDGGKWRAAEIPDICFADVAGLSGVKETITVRMIYPAKYPELYRLYKKQTGGGVLLYGPPGTGKTMIAKAIAHECGAAFFAVKGSDVMSKWVGESERNISELFAAARSQPRSIIFIDEVDALLGKRGLDKHNDNRVNEFLQAIDGFAGKNPNMLLLGATNRPWDVDAAALRSGRFSEKIYVPLPDKEARLFLFGKYTEGVPLASDVSIDELADKTSGLSGADISEICERAKVKPLLKAVADKERGISNAHAQICAEDFAEAMSGFKPTVSADDFAEFDKFAGKKLDHGYLQAITKGE